MKKAFSMIELIFAISILGILAAIALPKMFTASNDAKINTALANLKILKDDLSVYYAQHSTLPTSAMSIKKITNVTNLKWISNDIMSFAFPKDDGCISIILDNSKASITFTPSNVKDLICDGLKSALARSNLLSYENGAYKSKVDYLNSGGIYSVK